MVTLSVKLIIDVVFLSRLNIFEVNLVIIFCSWRLIRTDRSWKALCQKTGVSHCVMSLTNYEYLEFL